jgi:hypothetical protein
MLLSVLAMLVVGVSASSASAAMQFEWKVSGASLASGASKEFTAKDKGAGLFHLKFSLGGGATYEATSSRLKFAAGSKLLGGKAGTTQGALELEGVKMVRPANCQIREEKIKTVPLEGEIVEGAAGKEGTGKTELLLTPEVSTYWGEFEMENAPGVECADRHTRVPVYGSLLAEISPQKAEAKVGQLTLEAKGKEYRNAKGTYKTTQLEVFGNPANLTGEAELELVSKEAFGAF